MSATVVRLPTAARRQVKQPCNKAARAQRELLRKANPWPGKYLFPGIRDAMRQASLLDTIERSAVTEVLTALLAALDTDMRIKIAMHLAMSKSLNQPHAEEAQAFFRSTKMTVGEANDLRHARKIMAEPRGCDL